MIIRLAYIFLLTGVFAVLELFLRNCRQRGKKQCIQWRV